jgi:hypothetical protein
MVAYVFDTVLTKGMQAGQVPARTRDARDWYRNAARDTNVTPNRLMKGNQTKFTRNAEPGNMLLFNYDPKTKKKLPYYDTFPLIFVVGPAADGFFGLNMHYLPLKQRAMLMDALYETASDSRYDAGTRLKISYSILSRASRFKLFKPCLKHYLNSQVKSRFMQIDSVEWDIALFLPLQRFVGSISKVYQDSLRKAG